MPQPLKIVSNVNLVRAVHTSDVQIPAEKSKSGLRELWSMVSESGYGQRERRPLFFFFNNNKQQQKTHSVNITHFFSTCSCDTD